MIQIAHEIYGTASQWIGGLTLRAAVLLDLSRTLLYRIFKNKEEIYQAVFLDWLVSRHPDAKQAAKGPGSLYERLPNVLARLAMSSNAVFAKPKFRKQQRAAIRTFARRTAASWSVIVADMETL
jgi:AcrR family transcriptional regulator